MGELTFSATQSSRVILSDSTNWESWISTIRSIAEQYSIWQLCDPEIPDQPEVPDEPEAPTIEDAKKNYPDEWYQVMKIQQSEWTTKVTNHKKQIQGLNHVATAIKNSLHPSYQVFITYDTPWKLLRNLRQRFAPECDPTYAAKLRQQWRSLDRGLDRSTDIDKWLLNWETIQVRCARAGMREAEDASVQFLDAISVMSPIFHEVWTTKERDVSFPELLTRYKAHWAITHGKASTQRGMSKAVFSTWQGSEEAPSEKQPLSQRSCPCGSRSKGRHPAWKCWAAYETGRPDGYKVNSSEKDRWNKAMKADPEWKAFVEKKRSELMEKEKQAHTTMINDNSCGFFSSTSTVMSTQTRENHPMKRQWVVDTGAQMHVCNDRSLFVNFNKEQSSMKVGDTQTPIEGIGTVVIYGIEPKTGQPKRLNLFETRYSPNFHTNLISHGLVVNGGAFICFRNNWIETRKGEPLLKIYQDRQLTWLSQPDPDQIPQTKVQDKEVAFATKKSAQEPRASAPMETWHRRLGHVGAKRITKLSEMTEGITITESNPVNQVCEACQLADAPKQISRRRIGYAYGQLGRVHFDLVQQPPAYNGHVWMTHFYLDGIKCHFVFTHIKKSECQMAVRKFIAIMKNWLGISVKVFHYDNERSAGNEVKTMIEDEGCTFENSPPNLPEMNGPAERSGGIIVRTARALMNDTGLPRNLWPEAIYSATYILNRMPTMIDNQWIVPWNELMKQAAPDGVRDQRVNLSNIRLYGCLTYSRIMNMRRIQSDKMAPRAEIGFLVGYVSKNLYKIWFPNKNQGQGRVEIVRDAVFDETRRYSKDKPSQKQEEALTRLTDDLEILPEVLSSDEATEELSLKMRMPMSIAKIAAKHGEAREVEEVRDAEEGRMVEEERMVEEADKAEKAQRASSKLADPASASRLIREPTSGLPITPESVRSAQTFILPGSFPSASPSRDPRSSSIQASSSSSSLPQSRSQPPAISSSPDPISVIPSVIPSIETEGEEESDSERQLHQELAIPSTSHEPSPGYEIVPDHAPRDIVGGIEQGNILSGSRTRKPNFDPQYSAYQSLYHDDDDPADNPPELLHAFTVSMYDQTPKTARYHRDDMPPEPQNWAEMKKHRFAKEFSDAAAFEIETLRNKGTFKEVLIPNAKGTQVLPLKWVFTYKYDADGVLEKFKARICVRGDLQWITTEEKRAATLAFKTARAVFALVAAFDLNMIQRDVVTAFLNSVLQGEVYTKIPPGFEHLGHCWMLLRALYGLRMAPRLWQQEATRVLVLLGFTPVPEDPCIFIKEGIIVFFYVDDIIIVNHPSYAEQASQVDKDMKKHWEMRDLDANWFLNIRIIRDRSQKKLWLCQDSYIESMANRYDLITQRKVDTPMSNEPLLPYDGIASPGQIHGFQAKVGSAQYATTTLRPDAAKATAKAAEFLMNPGPKHIDAIDRIIQYLYQTRFWAIEYGLRFDDDGINLMAKSIEFASDASFGDNPDRRSSEGYVCKLYGGAIDWKASKQKTMTTSTTEAELLALAEARKTVQWWKRVLNALGFEPSHPLTIMCDNQQTVDLLTKEGAAMHTKLRHVDINRCWMRQEVSAGRANVSWVPTAQMPADGLTKPLPRQKQQTFREMLGMREISHLINPEQRPI